MTGLKLIQVFKTQRDAVSLFLLLLLIADVAFVLLHFTLLAPSVSNLKFSLEQDQSYAEIYQYVKELWIVVLLFVVLKRTKVWGYGAWAIVFLYVLMDDALRIHESFGSQIVKTFALTSHFGLRPQDLGELSVSGLAASFFTVLLVVSYVANKDYFRQVTINLIALVSALVFFGVFIDVLHSMVSLGWKVNFIIGAIEDGGEMIVMSFITNYVFYVVQYQRS